MRKVPDEAFVLDDVTYSLSPSKTIRSNESVVVLRKTRRLIDKYIDLSAEFTGARIVELGLWDGASTMLLTSLFQPSALVGFELLPEPLPTLERHLQQRGLGDRVHAEVGVDQADRSTLLHHVGRHMGPGLLDLVTDDASHLYEPTMASFETLFPLLRPGGLFIIEDWSHEHQLEQAIVEALRVGDPEAMELSLEGEAPVPLSRLVLALLMINATNDDVVAHIDLCPGFAMIRRGSTPLPTEGWSVLDHLLPMARRELGV